MRLPEVATRWVRFVDSGMYSLLSHEAKPYPPLPQPRDDMLLQHVEFRGHCRLFEAVLVKDHEGLDAVAYMFLGKARQT